MDNVRISLVKISYKNEINGTESYGDLFINDTGKLAFKGDVEESARVFFEDYLKKFCDEYIELIIDKRENPLFYWHETYKEKK